MRYTYKCYACMKTFGSDISYPRVDSGGKCPRCHTMITNAVNLVANAGPQYAPMDPFGNLPGARPRLERRNSAPAILPGVPPRQPPMAPMMGAMVAALPHAQPQAVQELSEQAKYDNLYRLYEGYRAWILGFIQEAYGKDLKDVRILIVPSDVGAFSQSVTMGGGGIYIKKKDGMKVRVWKQSLEQYEERNQKQVPNAHLLKAGECLVLLLKGVGDASQQLRDCWIIWHEYGHALGEPERADYGLSEAAAWKFELRAVRAALESGALARFGFDRETVRRFLDTRRPVYSSDTSPGMAALVKEVMAECEELERALA